jgi:Short C-terminal domain
MTHLSPKGARAVQEIAQRTGFSPDAVTAMLLSVVAGHGRMAQFSHPEFGGSGQWMGGGAIMISDMFNNALKARVDALCVELAELIRSEPDFVASGSFQSQSQGPRGNVGGGVSSLLATEGRDQANWWPADLGVPSSIGAQNEVRYAYFPGSRRLAIEINGAVTIYDTQDHQIGGFSQQQSGSGSLSFSSQLGGVDVSRLPVVSGVKAEKTSPEPKTPPEPVPKAAAPEPMHKATAGQPVTTAKAAAGHEDILSAIERLAGLHARGILTEAEFSAKKAELLARL